MISKEELAKVKEKYRTSLYQEEKEYLQYIFLEAISRFPEVAFKGGTCLRICYGLERSSEDLDFSCSLPLNKIHEIFNACMKNFHDVGIEHEKPIEREFQENIRFEVRFKGPLFAGNPESTNTLKIDFNKRRIYDKRAIVIPKIFSDVPLFTLVALSEKEILAEKIRAILNRKQPRDMYDIWMLVKRGVHLEREFLLKKLKEEHLTIKEIAFPTRKEYETELRQLVHVLPDYDFVREDVTEFITAYR